MTRASTDPTFSDAKTQMRSVWLWQQLVRALIARGTQLRG